MGGFGENIAEGQQVPGPGHDGRKERERGRERAGKRCGERRVVF